MDFISIYDNISHFLWKVNPIQGFPLKLHILRPINIFFTTSLCLLCFVSGLLLRGSSEDQTSFQPEI